MDRIVVGVDGSEDAAEALRWGADEARLHGTRATALLGWTYLLQYHEDPGDEGFRPGYDEADARAVLTGYVRTALGDPAGVELRTTCDLPSQALIDASETADLVVVGARGHGGFEGLLLGTVADRVAAHAGCPVAVVRAGQRARSTGPVLVGVDGSERSTRALRWAADEARARDVPIHVVHAWRFPVVVRGGWMPSIPSEDEARAAAGELLDGALTDPSLAGLAASGHLARTGPARSLMARADEAALVVVGTRGAGRVSAALLGSVSRQLLHHAPCPVVVV